jgi:hypothetical protein
VTLGAPIRASPQRRGDGILAGSVYSAALDGKNERNFLYGQGNLTGVAYAEI